MIAQRVREALEGYEQFAPLPVAPDRNLEACPRRSGSDIIDCAGHIPDRQIVEGKNDIPGEQARLLGRTIAPWIDDKGAAGGIEAKLACALGREVLQVDGDPATFLTITRQRNVRKDQRKNYGQQPPDHSLFIPQPW